MTTASYARYSTDRQSETSCDDQHRINRQRAEREGLRLAREYSDDGISGATPMHLRPQGAKLLAELVAGDYQVLIIEGLDRLARDLVDQERIIRRLEHNGVRIIGAGDGYDSHAGSTTTRVMHRGMRGIINEIYRHDVAAKTHRGLAGKHQRGQVVSSAPFGYTIETSAEGKRLAIVDAEAMIVREIFARFIAGDSPRTIAADLNNRRVPAPRSGTWCVSAIFGHPAKGCGILHQALYIGDYTWNRSRWTKDPDTGRRTRSERPKSEWQRLAMPELRILDDSTWHAAQARRRASRLDGGTAGRGRASRWLASGLVRCGQCGAPIVGVDARRYGCSAHKDRGPAVCTSRGCVRKDILEGAIVDTIRADLDNDQTLQELMQIVRELQRERNRREPGNELRAQHAAVVRQIENLTDAMARQGWSDAIGKRLQTAEAEQARLQRAIQSAAAMPAGDIIPRLADLARTAIRDIDQHLRAEPARARQVLRGLIGQATLQETKEGLILVMEAAAPPILLAAGDKLLGMVAGARFPFWKREILLQPSGRAL